MKKNIFWFFAESCAPSATVLETNWQLASLSTDVHSPRLPQNGPAIKHKGSGPYIVSPALANAGKATTPRQNCVREKVRENRREKVREKVRENRREFSHDFFRVANLY